MVPVNYGLAPSMCWVGNGKLFPVSDLGKSLVKAEGWGRGGERYTC